jgi:hypothetical protein
MKPMDMMWGWQRTAIESFIKSGLLELCTAETKERAMDGLASIEEILADHALNKSCEEDFMNRLKA